MESRKLLFFLLAFGTFVTMGMAGGLLNIAWTFMQQTFDVELESIGVLLLFATTGSLIAAFSSGTLIRRFGLGQMLIIGTLLVIAGLIGYVLVGAWFLFLLLTWMMYLGRGTLDAGLNNFVSARYGASEMNWLHAGWGMGLTVAPAVITTILLNGYSWRVAYGLMIVIFLLLLVVLVLTRSQWNLRKQEHDPASETITASVRETLRHPLMIPTIVLFFVYGGVEIATGQLANTLLVEGRGIAQETASTWISFYWGSFTVGRMAIGLLARYFSDRRILQACFALMLLGSVLLAVPGIATLSMFGLILIGLGLSAIFPILLVRTPQLLGAEHAPNAIGFQVGFAGFGGAVLPGIMGFFAQRTGLETISYGILFNAILFALLYAWIVRRESQLHRSVSGAVQ